MKDIGIDDAVIDVWVGNQNNMNVKVKNNGYYCDMIISGDVNIPDIHETVKFQTSFNFETGLSTIKPL